MMPPAIWNISNIQDPLPHTALIDLHCSRSSSLARFQARRPAIRSGPRHSANRARRVSQSAPRGENWAVPATGLLRPVELGGKKVVIVGWPLVAPLATGGQRRRCPWTGRRRFVFKGNHNFDENSSFS